MSTSTATADGKRWGHLILTVVIVSLAVMVVAFTCGVTRSRSSGHRWTTVVHCTGAPGIPGVCLPYPMEWGAWYVVQGDLHVPNRSHPTNYRYEIHYGEQVMWWANIRDNSGHFTIPFGIFYGMSNHVWSYSRGNLGNIGIQDQCQPLLIPGDYAVTGCFRGTLNLGKPGGHGEFKSGWVAVGTVIHPGDNVEYQWYMYH